MSQVIPPFGSLEVTIPAGEKICIASLGSVSAAQETSLVNYPDTLAGSDPALAVSNEELVSAAYASGATLVLNNNGPHLAYVEVGAAPLSKDFRRLTGRKGASTALDVSGDLTFAMMASGSITSAAATVQADLATGAVLEAASEWEIGEGFDWGVVKVGANTLTVTASAGHTLQGSGAVATTTSAMFRTVKTAASTFVTTRIG